MFAEVPLEVPIYKGAYLILTKNLNKAIGFVNGMGATVLGMDKNMSWSGPIRARSWQCILGPRKAKSCTTLCALATPVRCTKFKTPRFLM